MKNSLLYEHLIRQLFALQTSGKSDSAEAIEIRKKLFPLGGKVGEHVYRRGMELAKKLYLQDKANKMNTEFNQKVEKLVLEASTLEASLTAIRQRKHAIQTEFSPLVAELVLNLKCFEGTVWDFEETVAVSDISFTLYKHVFDIPENSSVKQLKSIFNACDSCKTSVAFDINDHVELEYDDAGLLTFNFWDGAELESFFLKSGIILLAGDDMSDAIGKYMSKADARYNHGNQLRNIIRAQIK